MGAQERVERANLSMEEEKLGFSPEQRDELVALGLDESFLQEVEATL